MRHNKSMGEEVKSMLTQSSMQDRRSKVRVLTDSDQNSLRLY